MRLSASDELVLKLAQHIVAMRQIVAIVMMPDDRLIRFQANLKAAIEEARNAEQGAGPKPVRETDNSGG